VKNIELLRAVATFDWDFLKKQVIRAAEELNISLTDESAEHITDIVHKLIWDGINDNKWTLKEINRQIESQWNTLIYSAVMLEFVKLYYFKEQIKEMTNE
jgi:hypothetical protein